VALFGTQLARVADRLADRTGIGEALVGAVFLGSSTSLPGIVTSVTAAIEVQPELAVSNALGGIAAQTAFLAIADIAYRRANLEHAAASLANVMQGALLIVLLTVPLLGMAGPRASLWHINPASGLLLVAYALGLRLVSQAQEAPMWHPFKTELTRFDEPDLSDLRRLRLSRLWLQFVGLAVLVGSAGYGVAQSGIAISEQTALSQSLVGGLLVAVATSLPELVTTVAAVRQRALMLAVGGVIGGNTFDVLFVAFADAAYFEGSIYHAISQRETFTIALTLLMTGVLLLGMLGRQRYGIGNIGFESFLVLLAYASGYTLLAASL